MSDPKFPWYLDGSHGQRLDDVTEFQRRITLAEVDLSRFTDERDQTIRALLADSVPVRAIVAASGLSRERVYQIRDKRR